MKGNLPHKPSTHSYSFTKSLSSPFENLRFPKPYCNTPFRSDPIGKSEPVLGWSFNYFYLLFIWFFFFFHRSVATRILSPTRRADPNRSPIYSNYFHLSYQNILFMSFCFRVFNYAEAFQMVGLKTITLMQFVYKMVYHAFTK